MLEHELLLDHAAAPATGSLGVLALFEFVCLVEFLDHLLTASEVGARCESKITAIFMTQHLLVADDLLTPTVFVRAHEEQLVKH